MPAFSLYFTSHAKIKMKNSMFSKTNHKKTSSITKPQDVE